MYKITPPDGVGAALLECDSFLKLKGEEVYCNAVFVGEDFTVSDAERLFEEAAEVPVFDASLKRQHNLIEQVAQAYGIDVAEKVKQEATDASPEWAWGVFVRAGEVFQFKGTHYSVIQPHLTQKGWEPPDTPALWKLVLKESPGEVYPAWVQPTGAHDSYAKDAIVVYKGKIWKNTSGTVNSWEPGVYGWTEYLETKGAKK